MKYLKKFFSPLNDGFRRFFVKIGIGMRAKLIIIFLLVKIVPLIILAAIAWRQFNVLSDDLRAISIGDTTTALNNIAVENIERLTTDTAGKVADFLYARDDDILYLSKSILSEDNFRIFSESKNSAVIENSHWTLSSDEKLWIPAEEAPAHSPEVNKSTNSENTEMGEFRYTPPKSFAYKQLPLYDEITFVDIYGNEQLKYVNRSSSKINYPMSATKNNISEKENTYIKAEDYFSELMKLKPGEIYVSDVIGAYVGTNYIGMYTPPSFAKDAGSYAPEEQAYAGAENPHGKRFEGIVRWATPVSNESGEIIGYITFALNHDHIMEFVDHITPLYERYIELPSAHEGNYAFIWDYKCRSICHPRHHSITGFDPETGEPEVPWLETSIYDGWQNSGLEKWTDYVKGVPEFDNQSRTQKKPSEILSKRGLVGLDGRYLNQAPQCVGWMDLTRDGGSGSFYILWSNITKLTTAAAIPYYTGHYAPTEENGYSKRGFGFVTIGAGLDDFTRPAVEARFKLDKAIKGNVDATVAQLFIVTIMIVILVIIIAVLLANYLTHNITKLIKGIRRFMSGDRSFRFNEEVRDEFGSLAVAFDDMADNVVNSTTKPIGITDMELNIVYMNKYSLEINNTTIDKVVGRSYNDSSFYPFGSKYCPITALLEGRESEIYYLKERDMYVKGAASYFLDKNGKKVGYIVETTDITEMIYEQMKNEEQRTLLDKIFSASPDLIWYQDVNGKFLTVNPRFASINGKSPEEFTGKTASEMFSPEIARPFAENDKIALSKATPHYSDRTLTFVDGHTETVDSVRTLIYDNSNTVIGILGFARDISVRSKIEMELRKTQADLYEAVNEANAANQHKGEFLARMSHEIRTPMNAIIGLTNIVLRKLDQVEGERRAPMHDIRDNVSLIETSSKHLLGLLNDILDITKIEAGKIDISEESVEISKLIDTVSNIIKPRCEEKNINFTVDVDDFSPSVFFTDPLRLRQVLINLLGNSVKFTPELGVLQFRILNKGVEDNKTLVEFTVRDNGIGISEETLATIFNPFEQGGSNISKQYGGTGLGLSISRRIVQQMGGDIKVTSKMGAGSKFSFAIWMTHSENLMPEDEKNTDIQDKFIGKKALLVDDVEINRMIVSSLLETTGIHIVDAVDGLDAVTKFKESPENTYDIILMDVQMPNMNGYEATGAIRKLDRVDAGSVPIIALTANAFKDDIAKARQHGMNAHIAKPIEMDNLSKILIKYLS